MKENSGFKIKQKRIAGITLISLVVTIIVLLILAGISINMLSGENSILKQATNSKKAMDEGEEIDKIELSYMAEKTNQLGRNVKGSGLQSEISKYADAEVYDNGDGTFYVLYKDSQNCYYVDKNGKAYKRDRTELVTGIYVLIYESGKMAINTDGKQTEEGNIRRIIDGVYERPRYSKLLEAFLPTDPEKVAYALARKYHWTISPCGDVALNKLGLSTQVPFVWSYVSDGPYREFSWDNITLSFKHKSNREISFLSNVSIIFIEAIKTLGKNNIDENVIAILKKRLNENDKKLLLKEAVDSPSWIFDIVKKVCE